MQALSTINCIDLLMELDGSPPAFQRTYKKRADPFQALTEEEFQKRYWFSKETAAAIVDLVKEDLELDKRGRGTSPALQVLTAISCWGRQQAQENVGDHHGLSQSTTSRICVRVERAIARNSNKMPRTVAAQLETMIEDYKQMRISTTKLHS